MKHYEKIKVEIARVINQILHKHSSEIKDYKGYKDLAPTSEMENGDEYIKTLNWALENPKIKNIALAGPYGAGKSSIIDSYLKADKEKITSSWIKRKLQKKKVLSKVSLKISMATFTQEKLHSGKKISVTPHEVEEGILKQLFYKVQHKKIPQSRYRKLHVENLKKIFVIAAITIFIVSIIFAIFSPELLAAAWKKIVNFVDVCNLPEKSPFIILILLWILVSFIISHMWCLLSNRYYLKEITLPVDAKIESDNELSDSVFNKNLDEIMYFFEATKYRIVFFEDLDRLDDRRIFVHLRELNNLLNNDDSIKEKPIVFVYAVTDDIFTKEDRTKFFDFIIPVIPVVNSTNSGEILLERIDKAQRDGNGYNISQPFILDVSPYISDMRILQNIYNEFVVYNSLIKQSQNLLLSDEQMMAIVIFKNLYPSDFADIQEERGIIKKAFENKINYIKQEKERLQTEINTYEEVISKVKSDNLKNVREIKAAMLVALTDDVGYTTKLTSGYNQSIQASTIMGDSFDMHNLANGNYNRVYYTRFSGGTSDKVINNFKEKITPFLERWDNFNRFEKEGEKNLLDRLEILKQKQHNLSSKSIAEVISECEDFCFDTEIADNKLLVFLLRRGYIDEKYSAYINYFKGNSITTEDINFILSVKNREPKDFSYSLTKTARVIQRLQEYEFEEKAVYNFDLMEQLLSNDEEIDKRNIFIQQLSDESDISWSFVDEFIDKTKFQKKFIVLLSSVWGGIWKYILELSTMRYERQLFYLSLLINCLNEDTIEKINTDNCVKEYMENHTDILQKLSMSTTQQALCSTIEKLNISFGIQDFDGVPDTLLKYIFDNCHYKLNEKMISSVVLYKNSALFERLKKQPYTTVIDLEYNQLLEYVDWNFDEYIENNVLNKSLLEDRVDVIKDMLSEILSNQEKCVALIELEQFQLEDITLFFEEKIENCKEDIRVIWDALLRNRKVVPTWQNIMSYWKYFSISEDLVDYIKSQISKLKFASTYCCTDEFIKAFISANLESCLYEQLLPVLKMKEFDLNLETLDINLLGVMIDIKYFDFTVTTYNYLFTEHYDLAVKYIIKNQEDFVEQQVEQIKMSSQLLVDLLTNRSLEDSTKTKLFDLFAESNMSGDIVDYVINNKIRITKEFLALARQYSDETQKDRLFRTYFELLNADDLEKYFAELDKKYKGFSNRTIRHEVELEESMENIRLAEYLKKVKYITSYEIVEREKINVASGIHEKRKVIKYRIKQKK